MSSEWWWLSLANNGVHICKLIQRYSIFIDTAKPEMQTLFGSIIVTCTI